jgi:pyruvate,water dikinase
MSDTTFTAPGPGSWELDATHFPRPATRFHAELFPAAMIQGFAPALRRYGSVLEKIDYAFVDGFAFLCPRPVGAPKGAKGPPPKPIFKLLTWLHPEVRRRLKTVTRVFEDKPWRKELETWDRETKPASIRAHLALQAVDPSRLSTAELLAHLERCREQVRAMIAQHHSFNAACIVPVGDLMVHVAEWTGLPPHRICNALQGASPSSAGSSAELDRVAKAVRASAEARALLSSATPPGELLGKLRALAGEPGAAVQAYVEMVGYRLIDGFDIGERYALEMPEVMLNAMRAAVASDGTQSTARVRVREKYTAELRAKVPEAHRAEFDALLEEARLVYRLRDERGLYSELWTSGITRRSVLEAGARLVKAGTLPQAALLCEASWEEMKALVSGAGGPAAIELAARAKFRATHSAADAPPFLGGDPPAPPPFDWLPPASRRIERAVFAVIQSMFKEPEHKAEAKVARGLPVSNGTYEGTARLVNGPQDFDRLQRGDVLVTRSTSAAFNIVLPLLGGIVTDRGGALCHAAIVAREYGIPGVVGCKDATTVIPDGARIRIDGEAGEARVLA